MKKIMLFPVWTNLKTNMSGLTCALIRVGLNLYYVILCMGFLVWTDLSYQCPTCIGLVSYVRPTSTKKVVLVNCVHKLSPTAPYSMDQSHFSILSHDTLHHCLSSTTNGLEDG